MELSTATKQGLEQSITNIEIHLSNVKSAIVNGDIDAVVSGVNTMELYHADYKSMTNSYVTLVMAERSIAELTAKVEALTAENESLKEELTTSSDLESHDLGNLEDSEV